LKEKKEEKQKKMVVDSRLRESLAQQTKEAKEVLHSAVKRKCLTAQ
jgi:hypothetical protein